MDGATADEIIHIIREHQFDPEVINAHLPGQMTPIMCAYWDHCQVGDLNYAIVEEFLKTRCVDVSHAYFNKRTLLHAAAMRGHDKIANALLERNVIDINARDCDGSTALIFAADLAPELALKLLEYINIDVSAVSHDRQTTERRTALHAVILSWNYTDVNKAFVVEKMLMKQGNIVDTRYYGPLQPVQVETFWAYNVTKNIKKNGLDGFTPLMLAAKYGHENVVRLLLQTNANCELHDDKGQTAVNVSFNDNITRMINGEINRRASHWPRCKNTLFGMTIASMYFQRRGVPKDVAAIITQNIVESTGNGLSAEDKRLFAAHNHEIVNHAYERARLKR